MNRQASILVLGAAVAMAAMPAKAATGIVTDVNFGTSQISLARPLSGSDSCGLGVATPLPFDRDTKFLRRGLGYAVSSSMLAPAREIEFECSVPGGTATKVTILDTSDTTPPSHPNVLGPFPLVAIVGEILGHGAPDRFAPVVKREPCTQNGIQFRCLKDKYVFALGQCRVDPASKPRQVECDYDYSDTLANLLIEQVDRVGTEPGLGFVRDRDESDGSTTVFVNLGRRIRVRLSHFPPTSSLTIEVY